MRRLLIVASLVWCGYLSATAALRFNQISPRPLELDAAGKESGWIELVNDGPEAIELSEWEVSRANRGKKVKSGETRFPSGALAAGATYRFLTSEAYDNCEDLGGDGQVKVYGESIVFPNKVNPKKYPYLALFHHTAEGQTELVDSVVVPVDLADGAVFTRDTSVTTRKAWSVVKDGETIPYGPNVSPLYGVKHALTDTAAWPLAVVGEDYEVSFPVNPLSDLAGDQIASVRLEYASFDTAKKDFGELKSVAMTRGAKDKAAGQMWTALIPAADLPAPGNLIHWRARITDGDGNVWKSPSFCNPDDCYEWYGTIVEPTAAEVDEKLQTWHLFVVGNSLAQMDIDADKQDLNKVPYNARAAIFDSQTGRFYDNVRIDLRGNTSGKFLKKSHGFKFAKAVPLTCTNPFTGEELETRKTSLVAEYCDPSYVRQSLAFHLFRSTGNLIPFHYPVRVNLNGEFYQLAFHSNRFSDELIEDYYKLDPLGYGYKNSGCLTPSLKNWVTCEKKTPDDGDETSAAAYQPLKTWTTYFGSSLVKDVDDQPVVTRAVVETFDLPAWINYLATARISMEGDDSWANLSTYWDKFGTGTWMPLGYDMNQSWGHIYYTQWNGQKPCYLAAEDKHKAHPFFGGMRVLCYFENGQRSHAGSENYALEAVWQSTKFRQLYLRRLRTLMDTQLGAPGTPKEETPIWDYVVTLTNAMAECVKLDYARWRVSGAKGSGTFWTNSPTYCWDRALTFEEGIDDLWEHYIVPRREHLYQTHSIHNTEKGIGYGETLSAGIPDGQLPLAALEKGLRLLELTSDMALLFNANEEAVDLSGWTLEGAIDWRLPYGTVIGAHDTLTIVKDRQAWVASHQAELGDRVIVGNAKFTGSGELSIKAVDNGSNTNAGFTFDKDSKHRWFEAQAQALETGADVTAAAANLFRGKFSSLVAGGGQIQSRMGIKHIAIQGDIAQGDALVFTPSTTPLSRKRTIIESALLFPDALLEFPKNTYSAFAALTLCVDEAGETHFAIFDGATWHFADAPGVPAQAETLYTVRLLLDYRAASPTVTYALRTGTGWVNLETAEGTSTFSVPKVVKEIAFAGVGEVSVVSGDYIFFPGMAISIH